MKEKRDAFSHAFLVMASLLAVAAITVAWFISSTGSKVDYMSFATQWSGTGAVIYPGTADPTRRSYVTTVTPNTLTNTVTWGEATNQQNAKITIPNMVPGQCEYYLIKANVPLDVFLKAVTIDDAEVVDGTKVPLAQCLAISFVPLDQLPPGSGVEPGGAATVTFPLRRLGNGQMEDTRFRGPVDTAGPISPAPAAPGYVMAVFCDPVYLQEGQVQKLSGTISFALTFAEHKG